MGDVVRRLHIGLHPGGDTGETVQKSYAVFLLKIPSDFKGVGRLGVEKERLVVVERGGSARTFTLESGPFSFD